MKKTTLITLFLTLVLILSACAGDSGTKGNDDEYAVLVRELTELSSYTIVRADKASDIEKKAVSALRDAIKEKTGVSLNVSTDFGGSAGREIIIGEANRSIVKEASETLRGDFDFIIKAKGNSILILGGSPETTAEAADIFAESFITEGKVYYPTAEEGYIELVDSPVKAMLVNGEDISEYKFYCIGNTQSTTAKPNSSFVSKVAERLGLKTGIRFSTVESISEHGKYIKVDTSCLDYTKGAIKIEDNCVTLYGSYHSIDYVIDYFFDTVIGKNEKVELKNGITELDSGDLPKIYTKDDLMKVLEYSYNHDDILIVGDQVRGLRTSPAYWLDIQANGGTDVDDETLVYPGTGKLPAALGIDLGRCGLRLPFLDEDQWGVISQIVCELVEYAARGGIVTVSSHFANPSGYEADWKCDRGNLGSEEGWRNLVTEGTEINTEWKKELELNAAVLKALSDAGVPVIWRPMHEMNTPSFWFCIGATGETLDASCYQNAWKYLHNYMTNEQGIKNLIWNYCPNNYNSAKIDVLYCYPGDEYVDIVAIDWYTGGEYEIGKEHDPYGTLMSSGKITNLGEVGIGEALQADNYIDQDILYSAEDFMDNFKKMIADGYKIGYMLTFNYKHTFAYLPGGDKIMSSDLVIDLEEMPALFEKAAGYKMGS